MRRIKDMISTSLSRAHYPEEKRTFHAPLRSPLSSPPLSSLRSPQGPPCHLFPALERQLSTLQPFWTVAP